MKIKLILLLLTTSLFISCEEGFEPTTEFKEDYVMYGILNGDSTYQSVVISKSYSAENFDPYSNTEDPDIKNAVVTINAAGKEYTLRDTSIERTDQSHYSTPEYFYYTNEFKPGIGDIVKIKAVLPNGKVLTSDTQLPQYSLLHWADTDDMLPIERIYDRILIRWELNNVTQNLVYLPRFFINYLQNTNGENIFKKKEIPLDFVMISGELKEKFPNASGKNYQLYDTTVVYNTIKNLKGGGPASDITIINAEVELTIMDENFGSYYSSIQTLNDGYTIRIYESNFSNINGGIGIFGSYFTANKNIEITGGFIRSFGYKSYY